MINFFKNKKNASDNWLSGYPAYQLPYIGVGRSLTEDQANENLAYLLANQSARLDALSTVLEKFNIDLAEGLASDTPETLINDLYDWAGEHWQTYHSKNHTRQQWLESNRTGEDIIYSVAMDTAIVFGELLIQHRPNYSWRVDLDSDNIEMASWRRCVLIAPMLTHEHMAIVDLEHTVAERVFNPDKPHWRWENRWLRSLNNCLSGAHEGAHLS